MTRTIWRRVLIVLGVVALLIGLGPGMQVQISDDTESRTWHLGLQSSPLFEHSTQERTSSAQLGTVVSRTSSMHIGLISWSSVSVALGAVFLLLARRLR